MTAASSVSSPLRKAAIVLGGSMLEFGGSEKEFTAETSTATYLSVWSTSPSHMRFSMCCPNNGRAAEKSR
eukprot:CAMPEP_0184495974 /NCGR_PEP_ID=MMETSP0113_2-20130426/32814_1 /TAXON_ID=91329 /ORGANISM="Norrisiella sphaerica, Strain BC52" /LENGTH=69 /DNA_ID=CAMNT_0026882409 /DNA_START=699 /DNA_END=908 /DNA_ORIENTATION=+